MEQLETIRSYWNTRADGYSKSVMEEMEDAHIFQRRTIPKCWILDADRVFLQ